MSNCCIFTTILLTVLFCINPSGLITYISSTMEKVTHGINGTSITTLLPTFSMKTNSELAAAGATTGAALGAAAGYAAAGLPGAGAGAAAGILAGTGAALLTSGNLTDEETIIAAIVSGTTAGATLGCIAGPKGCLIGGLVGGTTAATLVWYSKQQSYEDSRGMHLCWSGQGPITYDARNCKTEHFYQLNTHETTFIVNKQGNLTIQWELHNGISLKGKTQQMEALVDRFLTSGKTLVETVLIENLMKCKDHLPSTPTEQDIYGRSNSLYACLLDFNIPLNPRYISYTVK